MNGFQLILIRANVDLEMRSESVRVEEMVGENVRYRNEEDALEMNVHW